MAIHSKRLMVHGEIFKNEDFYFTKEYFEMMRLWNKLNQDQYFGLGVEVMRENPDAIRLWELFTVANDIHIIDFTKSKVIRISKRGPQRYSDKEKLTALQDWDEVDKSITPITLSEFLGHRFCIDNGVLGVAESTFHGWRRQLRKKGKYNNS